MAVLMSVATNFDPALPAALAHANEGLEDARVTRAFGSLPADCVGGGRPAHRLPELHLDGLATHIADLASRGIDFAYTLNAPELFGAQDDSNWRKRLECFLAALRDAGVLSLVVSNPWLLEHLQRERNFALTLSLIGGVASPEQAARAQSLGVATIALAGHQVARDLPMIKKIRAATDLPLELNANMGCLHACPWAAGHYRSLGALSREDLLDQSGACVPTEPHILACSCRMLAEPGLYARTTFVPPSYVERYMEAGVDRFKFSDRVSQTSTLLRTVEAYGRQDRHTDLFELVYKGGSKLKAGLKGLFPAEFVRSLPVPRISIDARRFWQADFIEQQAVLPEAELDALTRSIVRVHEPAYLIRFLAFLEAVRDRLDWRQSVPVSELPAFEALRELIEPVES